MAKFRSGDLVLTSSQKLIQGSETLIDAGGVAEFASLDVSGLTTLSTLTFAAGATINLIDAGDLSTNFLDTSVPTQKAVKTYVDAQVGGVVPPGTDEAIVRYNGINLVQDSGIFIDDSDNVTGINDLNVVGDLFVDGTATISAELYCDDLYVSGSTIYIGDSSIKSFGGQIWLFDNNDSVMFVAGPTGAWVGGALAVTGGLQLYEGGSAKWTIRSVSDIMYIQTGVGVENAAVFNPNGAVALYYDNNIAFQTTVDGADIRDTSGANAKLNLSASNGTPMAVLQTTSNTTNDLWISATQSAGNIYLATQTSSVGLKINDGGSTDLYYDGAKVSETTANGITGAVWG